MIRWLTTRLQTTELQFKLERNKIMYSIYDKMVDYKTTELQSYNSNWKEIIVMNSIYDKVVDYKTTELHFQIGNK